MNSKVSTCLTALLLAAPVLRAQGTVLFSNRVAPTYIDAPIYYPDGITRARAGTVYAGLWAGPDADSLAPVGTPVLLGPRDGFFGPVAVTVPTVPVGELAWCQVRLWDARAEGFDDARAKKLAWGASDVLIVQTGGIREHAVLLPGYLVGLESITMVPEPSSATLLGLGGGLWLWRARRRKAGRRGR